ncbi:MAG: hypothetical protein DRJ03_28780 [Chloroflexi bacterium]|nr:MAG: hypothetical protein DRJ03_28780 [Chloroflexota bacterium]
MITNNKGQVYLKIPEWAWEILSETLIMDTESSWNSLEIRAEISRAMETVEIIQPTVTQVAVLDEDDLEV